MENRRWRRGLVTRCAKTTAARLRAVEQACRMAIERDTAFTLPETTTACRSPGPAPDSEIELE